MGKNAQIHFVLDSESLKKIKGEANTRNVSVSELCRRKALGDPQSDRIEVAVNETLKILKDVLK